ncbi:hypothetical protein BT93_B0656 [Corymbia citriodora subsp. variegata]|nr:hypothetical protein BT93_B0656 [Corymbia citriodora subsp. variegata]
MATADVRGCDGEANAFAEVCYDQGECNYFAQASAITKDKPQKIPFKRPAIENETMQGQSQAKKKKIVGLGVDTNPMTNLHILNHGTRILNLPAPQKHVVVKPKPLLQPEASSLSQSCQAIRASQKHVAVKPKPLSQPKVSSQPQSSHATIAPRKHVVVKPKPLLQPEASSQPPSCHAIRAPRKHVAVKPKAPSQPQASSYPQSSHATTDPRKHIAVKPKLLSQSKASSQPQLSHATTAQKHVAVKRKVLSQPESYQATTTPPKLVVARPYIRKSSRIMNKVKAKPGPPETIELD